MPRRLPPAAPWSPFGHPWVPSGSLWGPLGSSLGPPWVPLCPFPEPMFVWFRIWFPPLSLPLFLSLSLSFSLLLSLSRSLALRWGLRVSLLLFCESTGMHARDKKSFIYDMVRNDSLLCRLVLICIPIYTFTYIYTNQAEMVLQMCMACVSVYHAINHCMYCPKLIQVGFVELGLLNYLCVPSLNARH